MSGSKHNLMTLLQAVFAFLNYHEWEHDEGVFIGGMPEGSDFQVFTGSSLGQYPHQHVSDLGGPDTPKA
jgi:hypothetical protein